MSALIYGKSIKNLTATIEKENNRQDNNYNLDNIKFLTLYKLSKNIETEALCDLSDGLHRNKFETLNKNEGLSDQAFWYPLNSPPFNDGSIFFVKKTDIKYTIADAIAAVAVSIQHMRSNKELSANFPNASVLNYKEYIEQDIIDPNNYLTSDKRFFDEAFYLSIIRCASNPELKSSQGQIEHERGKWVSGELDKDENHYITLEFIVAMLQEKLPMPNDLNNIPSAGNDTIQKFLDSAIKYLSD